MSMIKGIEELRVVADSSVLKESGGKIVIRLGDDNEVGFMFSTFKRDALEKNSVFQHLNNYWATKPKAFREKIFQIYAQMADYFFQINDKVYLCTQLQKSFKELIDAHPFDELRHWVVHHSNIKIPDISEEFVRDVDRDYTPEKTYIRPEYIDMLTYGLIIRTCVPVWAYYMRVIKNSAGTGMKEKEAFDLLELTYLYKHPVMTKIEAYLGANMKRQVVRSGPMGLVHPDDNPRLIAAMFVVLKLSLVELQPVDSKASIVSLLFGFARTAMSEGNYQERFKDKNPHEGGSEADNDGGNKVSVHERHRNSTDISIEEAAELNTALGTVEESRQMLIPSLPAEDLQRSINSSAQLMDIDKLLQTALPCQKTILSWILAPILPPIGMAYQDPKTVVAYLALAEAALWKNGYQFLALLMTARIPQDTQVLHVSSTPFRSRLSEENLSKIRELYPHVRVVQNRKSDPREECLVLNAIDSLSSDISEYTWLATAEEAMVKAYQRSSSRRLAIPPDIRNELASLIISLNNKSFYL